MTATAARLALAAATAGLASGATGAERFDCAANVTCTFEWGCRGGDIPWTISAWKDGEVWNVTDEPEGGIPYAYAEIDLAGHPGGALFLERVWLEGDRQRVSLLTILPDRRMIMSWQDDGPWQASDEHTVLGACQEAE